MTIKFKLVHHLKPKKHWSYVFNPGFLWKYYFKPPWLLFFHFLETCLMIYIYIKVILPMVRNIFMAQKTFTVNLCPDIDYNKPYSNIEVINDFIETFQINLDKLMRFSFLNLEFVDEDKPFEFIEYWSNGTISRSSEAIIDLDMFYHIEQFVILTEFYSFSRRSSVNGCTKWKIASVFSRTVGGCTFTSYKHVERYHCPQVFTINDDENHQLIMKYNQVRGLQLSQAKILRKNSTILLFISILNIFIIFSMIVHKTKQHLLWYQSDPDYKDLDMYSQIHFSFGYWFPLHLIAEICMFVCSIKLLIECEEITQYVSTSTLYFFAFSFLFTVLINLRSFVYVPKLYQLISIIRVCFRHIINIFIGLSPLVVGTMFFGSFFFGFVSDISKSFMRFLQLFIGVTFGDDLFYVFTYYTDGSNTLDTLAFFYVTFIAILAGYICFPAFTATISHLHKTEILASAENNIK